MPSELLTERHPVEPPIGRQLSLGQDLVNSYIHDRHTCQHPLQVEACHVIIPVGILHAQIRRCRQRRGWMRPLSRSDVQPTERSAKTINQEGRCGRLHSMARVWGPHHGDERLKHGIKCLSHHALDALRSLFCSPRLARGRLRRCRLGGQLENWHRSDATHIITLSTPTSVCRAQSRRWRSLGVRWRRKLLC